MSKKQGEQDQDSRAYPWDQMDGESNLAFLGFDCFRKLGLGRTIEGAWRQYEKKKPPPKKKPAKGKQKKAKVSRPSPSFYRWAKENEWWDRAKHWDYYISRLANKRVIAKREKILEAQFKELDQIVTLCTNQLKVWLDEQKDAQKKGENPSPIRGLSPFVVIQSIQSSRKAQLEGIEQLAKAQAIADAEVFGEVEEDLAFFDDDEDEEDLDP